MCRDKFFGDHRPHGKTRCLAHQPQADAGLLGGPGLIEPALNGYHSRNANTGLVDSAASHDVIADLQAGRLF